MLSRRSTIRLLAVPLLTALAPDLCAQVTLVKDITPQSPWLSTPPLGLTEINALVVFAANDGIHGYEPWVSDGTPAGTRMLVDIFPGISSSIWAADPQVVYTAEFSAVRRGNQVWFFADSGLGETELWVSDGTTAGTMFVQRFDVPPSSYYSGWQMRGTVVHGELVFLAYTQGGPGWRLWRTDTSTGGLLPIASVGTQLDYRGVSVAAAGGKAFFVISGFLSTSLWGTDLTSSGTSWLAFLGTSGQSYAVATAGDRAVFASPGVTNGLELWSSDGTVAGTGELVDIRPGSGSSAPRAIASCGRYALFAADDGTHGVEPWITDGTAAGTALLIDAQPGPGNSDPVDFVPQHHRAWFATRSNGEELWLTDGTTAGTTQIASLGSPGVAWNLPNLTAAGSRRMFLRSNNLPDPLEPWTVDGTTAGTSQLANINGLGGSSPSRGVLAGGSVFFTADDGITGRELYRWFPGASSQLVGEGLGTTGRAPRLFATDPVIGGSITFDGDAQPNMFGVIGVNYPAAPVGSLFTADLWVALPAPILLPVQADPQGSWSAPPINLPNIPGLTGIRLAAQGVFTAGGPFDLTNGALLTLGL